MLSKQTSKVWQRRQCMKLLMGLALKHIHPLPATPGITLGAVPHLPSRKTSQIHSQIPFSLFLAEAGVAAQASAASRTDSGHRRDLHARSPSSVAALQQPEATLTLVVSSISGPHIVRHPKSLKSLTHAAKSIFCSCTYTDSPMQGSKWNSIGEVFGPWNSSNFYWLGTKCSLRDPP